MFITNSDYIYRGFDIVIGNPPYGANIDNDIDVLKKIYPDTSKAFKDIYKYFFDLSIRILSMNGVLTFITPNTFLRQPRYKDLRQLLLNYKIESIIDLGENVFENVVVPTAISIIKKNTNESEYFVKFGDLTKTKNPKNHINSFTDIKLNISLWKTEETNYSFVNMSLSNLKNSVCLYKILDMKDAGINYQRVNVGLSQKGKSDLGKRLLYSGNRENISHIEFWKGEDIEQYFIKQTSNRFCRTRIKLKDNERVILNKEYFEIKPKLLWRQTAEFPITAIDYKGLWFGRSIQAGIIKSEYIDKISYEYLCALLNSKYLRYKYNLLVKETGRVFPQVKLEKLKPLPIYIPNEKEKNMITDIVNKILAITTKQNYLSDEQAQEQVKKYQLEIDKIVYTLYDLTQEEINIIEK